MQKKFLGSLFLLILLNVLVKPLWIFGIDRGVQNITGFAAYGQYFAMLNFCMVFGWILDPGFHIYMNRSAASQSQDPVRVFWDTFYSKTLLMIAYLLVLILAALLSGLHHLIFLFPYALLIILLSVLGFLRTFLSAAQQYREDAILSVADKLVVIIAVGTWILYPGLFGGVTIERFLYIQIASIGFTIVLAIAFIVRHIEGFQFLPFKPIRREFILSSLPFAMNIFLMTIILRAHGFMLERLHPDGAHQAGVYAAGFRMLEAFSMMGTLVSGFLLSFMAKHWPDKERFEPSIVIARRLLMCAALLIGVTGMAMPQFISQLLYHRSDALVVSVMRSILLALPALSLVSIHGTILTATGHIQTFVRISLIYAVLSVCLNIWLIPVYGALGCSIISVAVLSAYAISLVFATRKDTGIGLGSGEALAYLFVGLMCFGAIRILVFLGMAEMPAIAITGICTVVLFYAILGMGFRDIRKLLQP